MASNSSISDKLYGNVESALSQKKIQERYKQDLDKYLAANSNKYFIIGPGERPIFSDSNINNYIQTIGLDTPSVKKALKEAKNIGSNWNIMNNPFNVCNAMATRYFTIKKNEDFIKLSQWYLLVALYPSLHSKYFKYGVNQACMDYTINNLSDKYRIKQVKSLWAALTEMIVTAYALHKDNLIKGTDMDYVKYVQDVHTRMNSLIQNIAVKYYDNHKNQRFLEKEFESFEEDNYHEADSNSYQIVKITNNVVNHLCMHGADMKLVELAAKSTSVSVNEMRNYCNTLIDERHREDIHNITESILFVYLFNTDGEVHSTSDIGTNDFTYYCLQMYKKSNTVDKNIIRIKDILQKWLIDVGVIGKNGRGSSTILQFKKAFFTFFVMSIQKYWR